MKILHITDSHGTVKGPESRKDIYYITFLKKLYELGLIIKKYNINMVIHTGDLFHTARVSDKFAGQVSEMIKAMEIPFYVVPGNHDIEGYTTDTIDQTKLGLLAKAKVVTILDRDNPICITVNENDDSYTVAISGQEYYAHIDEGNYQDFEMQQDHANINILAMHGYIADIPQHPDIKCTMTNDIISDADIILTGHYHRQFEYHNDDFSIYNPGSMMRVEQTEYNKTHIPQYGILEITQDKSFIEYDYTFHEFRIAQPSTVIFDYNSKYKAKLASITLTGFKNSIANTMNTIQPSSSIENIINDICLQSNTDSKIQQSTLDIYHDTLQTIPDEFEVQQGFIESQNVKKISKLVLNNFQSHEYTEIEFNDGLNIIVGESNNGKTSILRAIMWAIDNQPLGTDFIMAGKDNCSVRIEYNDGTFIERGRTLKNTGYYEIGFIDENNNLVTQSYQGFTNAVPIEVANTHQMPKINITKDIETHLNVLSQLDGPFLLTESPITKASAIGRITGTHVIDAAIKDSNKSILNNNKAIKIYNQELSEKENELKTLPDIIAMSDFVSYYCIVLDYIKQIDLDINKIDNYINNIQDNNNKIILLEKEYNNYISIQKIKPLIDVIDDKISKVKTIDTFIESYNATCNDIINYEQVLNKYNILSKLNPLIVKANNNITYISILSKSYESLQQCNNNLSIYSNQYRLLLEYKTSLNNIIAHCKLLYDYNLRITPKVNELSNIEKQLTDTNRSIKNITDGMKYYKGLLTSTQNNKNNFILNNNICPCCGQSVEQSHTNSIIKFMEDNQ